MTCDLCKKEMEEDETGIVLILDHLGGHIACARKYLQEKETNKETT